MATTTKKIGVHGTDAETGRAKENGAATAKKTTCTITRKAFTTAAKALVIKVGEDSKVLAPKQFSTGSFGWFGNEKVTVVLPDGTPVVCQANLQLTVVNSKDAKDE